MWFRRKENLSTPPPLMVQPLVCILCGAADIEERRAPFCHQLSQGPVVVPHDWHIWCHACQTVSHPGVMFSASLEALLQTLREADRVLNPAELKALRRRHRISDHDIRTLLGCGFEHWRTWEAGTASPSKAQDALIRSTFALGE